MKIRYKNEEIYVDHESNKWIEGHTIYRCLGGSHAYGLNTETSDMDIRGICIPPKEFYFGLQGFEQQVLEKVDCTIFGLKKFVKLARDCNPNIIELLFLKPESILYKDKYADELLKHRELFVSEKAIYTFSGYANSQLNRIKLHKKWLDNPPEKPEKESYIHPVRGLEILGEYKFDKFGFDHDKKNYKAYQTWLKERNEDRLQLELKYGYDTKHAMHLIRLLKMGHEIISTGQVNTYREADREELLSIRNGALSYDELLKYAQDLEDQMRSFKGANVVPHSPNDKAIIKLVTELTDSYFCEKESE